MLNIENLSVFFKGGDEMGRKYRRIISFMLTVVMLFTAMPAVQAEAQTGMQTGTVAANVGAAANKRTAAGSSISAELFAGLIGCQALGTDMQKKSGLTQARFLEAMGLAQRDTQSGMQTDAQSSTQTGMQNSGQTEVPECPEAELPLQIVENQEAADLLTQDSVQAYIVKGDGLSIPTSPAEYAVILQAHDLTISGSQVKYMSVIDAADVTIKGSSIGVLTIFAGEEVTLHIDETTAIDRIVLMGGGSVAIEGPGEIGRISASAAPKRLQITASTILKNMQAKTLNYIDPDGEEGSLKAWEETTLTLSRFCVQFVTEGTEVENQYVEPGSTIDAAAAETQSDGMVFTAWYEDEAYTTPYHMTDSVIGNLTLYARFVQPEDAVWVTLDRGGEEENTVLAFAKGECLLVKPLTQLLAYKEGYTFAGWSTEKDGEAVVSYTDPIEDSMTLYAMLISGEEVIQDQQTEHAELNDFAWDGGIALKVPEGMGDTQLESAIAVEGGASEEDPAIRLERGENGQATLYGDSWEQDGTRGFAPGSSVMLTVSDGVTFADYGETTETLTIRVYKPEVEVVDFKEDLTYILWDELESYTPEQVPPDEDMDTAAEEEAEEPVTPGTLVLNGTYSISSGDVLVMYDGEIGEEEKNIDDWTEGSFDGYVLYALVDTADVSGGKTTVTFTAAEPEQYLDELDVHTTRETDLEGILTAEEISRFEREIAAQVVGNEEVKAQMLASVLTSGEAQQILDEQYGSGVYSLSKASAAIKVGKPQVKLTVNKSKVTAKISITATVTVKDGNKTLLNLMTTLAFTQEVGVSVNLDAGKFWVDASVSLRSVSTISLTMQAKSGGKAAVLEKAKNTLQQLVKPEGLTDADGYQQPVSELMGTMQGLVQTSLPYVELFSVRLMTLKFSFHGIVTLTVTLDLVGEIGIIASFGVEIVVKNGQKVGMNYNFKKFKGKTYTQKLENSVNTTIYVVGKVGVRIGLRLTISLTLCGCVTVSIVGTIYAYAELTGMYFLTASLTNGSASQAGALHFEVGIDARIDLKLRVKILFIKKTKSWNVWSDRWPLYQKEIGSKLSIMDTGRLDTQWKSETRNEAKKSVFQLNQIPTTIYDLASGKASSAQTAWNTRGVSFSWAIKNVKVNGAAVSEKDPRYQIFRIDGGKIRVNESLAAQYGITKVSCDLELTYKNNEKTALVKKQTHTLHLEKSINLVKTTVVLKFKVYDWCARQWGIERAAWDGKEIAECMVSYTYVSGTSKPKFASETINKNEVLAQLQKSIPELNGAEIGWGANNARYLTQIRNGIWMDTTTGAVRFSVSSKTATATMEIGLFAHRYAGTEGTVTYVLKADGAEASDLAFQVQPNVGYGSQSMTYDPRQEQWSITCRRSDFTAGSRRALMVTYAGGEMAETGIYLTGRESQNVVYLNWTVPQQQLSVQSSGANWRINGGGWNSQNASIRSGQLVTVEVEAADGWRGVEVQMDGRPLAVQNGRVSFRMPNRAAVLTLKASKLYTISYYYNIPDREDQQYVSQQWAENEPANAAADPSADGLTFRGWYINPKGSGEPYTFGQYLNQDVELYADWTCDITVDFNGGEGKAAYLEDGSEHLIDPDNSEKTGSYEFSTLRIGAKLPQLSVPERDGYEFAGWALTKDAADGVMEDLTGQSASGGLTIYAVWNEIYKISYELNGGQADGNPEAYTIASETIRLNRPTREGYEFLGWTGTDLKEPAIEVVIETGSTGNRSYTANWKAIEYTIHYELNGGTVTETPGNPDSYTIESSSITLQNPTREGYEFYGWTGTDLKGPTLEVVIGAGSTGERSYSANWKAITYTISYELNGGSVAETPGNPDSYTIESSSITLQNPTREGYEFLGWTGTDLEKPTIEVVIETGSIGNRRYAANWTKDGVISYHITYELNGGAMPAESGENPTDYTEETETFVLLNPVREGYEFLGWTGTGLEEPTREVIIEKGSTGNRSYTANWEVIEYSISYNLNGADEDELDNPGTYGVESESITLQNPSRTGYEFLGWTGTGLEEVTLEVIIPTGSTGDRSYTANWKAITYTISYELDGGAVTGTPGNPDSYTIESEAITLQNPTKEGYEFLGWTGEGLEEPTQDLVIPAGSTGNRTYTANWKVKELVVYEITYELNGGMIESEGDGNPTRYTEESETIILLNPVKNGYEFVGWTGTDLKEPTQVVVISIGSTGNRSYTANWKAITYTITYDLNGDGAEHSNPSSYTSDMDDFELAVPKRPGYVFTGWTGTGLEKETVTVVIKKGTTGNLEYMAHWGPEEPTVDISKSRKSPASLANIRLT